MTGWVHNICAACYEDRFDRNPCALMIADEDECCFCGKAQYDGLYVRCHPKETKCKHKPIGSAPDPDVP